MKVLQVGKFYPPHRGGMESHLEALCQGMLGRAQPEVLVAAEGRRTTHEVVAGVPVTRVASLATLASASLAPGMISRIRRSDAEVVHFHHPNPPAALALLASGWSGPVVVTYHSDIVRQRVLGALVSPLTHALLRRAALILATSPAYLETSPVLRAHRPRCRVVPFGVDVDALQDVDPAAVREVRDRFGPRIVLAAGRLVYYKGFDYLIRAMHDVSGRLLLAGGGPLAPRLRALAAECGVADRVTFLGPVPDLRPYLHAADVFVLPSVERSEAFGLVQLEAMSVGTPVVNTALESGVPWVSPHGRTGLTVPPRDPRALAAGIRRVLDDGAYARRLGEAGRARARGELSLAGMVDGTLAAYQDVVGWTHPSRKFP